MGGTSFDVSLVVDGKPDVSSETTLEGFPLLMTIVNIHTIGAGGGSLAYAEAGGLRVGPAERGRRPRPRLLRAWRHAADRHRRQPRARPRRSGRLRRRAAWRSTSTRPRRAVAGLAAELGLGDRRARRGHLRRHQRQDGAGDPHAHRREGHRAARLRARRLRRRRADARRLPGAGARASREVIVPPFPGAFSAWGMLETEIRKDLSAAPTSPRSPPLDRADLAADPRGAGGGGLRRASPRRASRATRVASSMRSTSATSGRSTP